MAQPKQEQESAAEEGIEGGEWIMPRRQTERTSEAAWKKEHSDDILEHLPASFQVLAKFALKRGDGDASAKPTQ